MRNFREQGIDISHVGFDEERSSGVAPIMVEEQRGQIRIIVVPGANDSLSPRDEEALEAARVLRAKGPRSVIVTLGERGAVGIGADGGEFVVEAERVQAVDTTGAGDAFVGSLAYFLGRHLPLKEAVERSCRIATMTVLKAGTQSSFPTRGELGELLAGFE